MKRKCTKIKYYKQLHVLYAIKKIQDKNKGLLLDYYKCPYCRKYHLTGKPRWLQNNFKYKHNNL